MIEQALSGLWYGFGVAFEPHNLMWCFVGVLVLQPDFGQTMLIALVWGALFFIAGMRLI